MAPAQLLSAARAVLLGVARYADPNIPSLPGAVRNDVNDLRALLCDPARAGFLPSGIKTLVDENANREAILEALRWLSEGEASTRLLYFSGHGSRGARLDGGSCLLPYDAVLEALPETAIEAAILNECLRSSSALRLVVLLDACHAGGAAEAKSSGPLPFEPGVLTSDLDALVQGEGRVVMAACGEHEKSWVLPGHRNSVFTGALIQGLSGEASRSNDGFVRVLDLFDYVSREVPKRATQHPVLKVHDMNDNFPIARLEVSAAFTPANTRGDAWWTELHSVLTELYPQGPESQSLWRRAGGDESRLVRGGDGRQAWYAALRQARLGGGVNVETLLAAAIEDFPLNARLSGMR